MTAKRDLEQRLADYYRAELPLRAPDRVLVDALATVETTRQRRALGQISGLAPWRITVMRTYALVGAAAVAVIAVVAIGYALSQSTGPGPAASGSPSPGPTIAPTPDLRPTARPNESRADGFWVPFTYVLPAGIDWAYGPSNRTTIEMRDQGAGDAGRPAGLIIQVVQLGYLNPCLPREGQIEIGDDPEGVISFIKRAPDITVSDEAPTAVGGYPALSVTATAQTDTPTCDEIWLWVDMDPFTAIPRQETVRMIAVDVAERHLVLTVFGESDNPDWTSVADELTASVRFAPLSAPSVEAAPSRAERFFDPFSYSPPTAAALTLTREFSTFYAFSEGLEDAYPEGYSPVPGVRGITVSFSTSPRTHGDGHPTVALRPVALLADLRVNTMLDVGEITPAQVDGINGTQADVTFRGDIGVSSSYPDLHMTDAVVALQFPSHLFVVQTEGGVLVVQVWAGTADELAAWLPVASSFVESLHFE